MNKIKSSLVSICIPTYNGEKFLEAALLSIQRQTYRNFEVIISDDNSKDQTGNILKKFQVEVHFPVSIYGHDPAGIGANWNNCINKAKGEYIKFLFQDDVLMPTCIEEMVDIISKDNTIGLVGCKRKLLIEDEIDEETSNWINQFSDLQKSIDEEKNEVFILSKSLFKSSEFFNQPLNKVGEPSTILFRKELLEKVGFFREDMVQSLDYEFYYRVLKYNKIAILNKYLAGFRIHSTQTTKENKRKNLNDREKLDKIFYKNLFWHLNPKEKKRLLIKYNPLLRKVWKFLQ